MQTGDERVDTEHMVTQRQPAMLEFMDETRPLMPSAPPACTTALITSTLMPASSAALAGPDAQPSPRPKGRTPRVRTPEGKTSDIPCMWDGFAWVAPPGVDGSAPTTKSRQQQAASEDRAAHVADAVLATASERSFVAAQVLNHVVAPGTTTGNQLVVHEPPSLVAGAQERVGLHGTLSHAIRQQGCVPEFDELAPPPKRRIPTSVAAGPHAASYYGDADPHAKQQQFQLVESLAIELDLAGPLGPGRGSTWEGQPDEFERMLEAALMQSAQRRVQQSTEPESILYTFKWYRIYRACFPHRVAWRELVGGAGDMQASLYNEDTILMVGELMRMWGSIKPGQLGKTLTAKTIAAVQSTLRAFKAREAGHRLHLPSAQLRTAGQGKDMRREDGPAETRKRREGFRAQHFEAAALGGLDRTSRQGVMRWAVLHFCHNAVARGSSAGTPKRSTRWEPVRGLVCSDVSPVSADVTGTGARGFMVRVFPGKDCRREHVKRPIPVSGRATSSWGGSHSDPRDAYLALDDEYQLMLQEVPEHARWHTPFFRRNAAACAVCSGLSDSPTEHVCALDTRDVAAIVGDARAAMGLSRDDHELAQELRIGGASDVYDVYGYEGKEILERRGRWGKDIAYIYARVSAQRLFEASARMADASGVALESLVPDWTQGTNRL